MSFDAWENVLIKNKPQRCEACKGKLYYQGAGRYSCKDCGKEVLDVYGKLYDFLEQHEEFQVEELAEATGVDADLLEEMLQAGTLILPEDSSYYRKCVRCGCSIRTGSACASCGRKNIKGVQDLYDAERERRVRENEEHHKNKIISRMHFSRR